MKTNWARPLILSERQDMDTQRMRHLVLCRTEVHHPNRMVQKKEAAVGIRDEEHGIWGQDCPGGLPVLRVFMLK